MKVSQEMYTKLFNAITDARKLIDEASRILDEVQVYTEQLYMEQGDSAEEED